MYLKDTEKWKQFTTTMKYIQITIKLLCISKILKNESNSQRRLLHFVSFVGCCVSQRYWKMKAIHNTEERELLSICVVVYLKDTEKWKQFTTAWNAIPTAFKLLCISKILKNESNSQQFYYLEYFIVCCCVSQRYWKMKAIHNLHNLQNLLEQVVVYLKDTEKWKQFTTCVSLVM